MDEKNFTDQKLKTVFIKFEMLGHDLVCAKDLGFAVGLDAIRGGLHEWLSS
jgi:hypothetical protein